MHRMVHGGASPGPTRPQGMLACGSAALRYLVHLLCRMYELVKLCATLLEKTCQN
jgi:hypothetical protein